MTADTVEELHGFAVQIGMKRSMVPGEPERSAALTTFVPARRAKAVKLGAKEINQREAIDLYKRLRDEYRQVMECQK